MANNDFRGVILSSPMRISDRKVHLVHGGLDPQELRFSLLFWDRIDYPSNNALYMELDPEGQFLLEEGILQRTEMSASGELSAIVRASVVAAFEHLDRQNPGCWSVATGDRSVVFLDDELEVGRGALISLHRALPIPDKSVPLHDLLEFRTKRRPELLCLRAALDEAYLKVAASPDPKFALSSETSRVERACADYVRSTKGFGLKCRMMNLDASLNLAAFTFSSVFAYQTQMPLPTALNSIITSTFAVNVGAALRKKPMTSRPYQYISRYHNEVFII